MKSLLLVLALTPYSFGQEIQSPTQQAHAAASKLAIAQDKPLFTFVGIPAEEVKGAFTSTVNSMEGAPAKCVVVSKPNGRGGLYWANTYPNLKACFNPGYDSLDEVNAWRARRGLYPFLHDERLTIAARRAAAHRARYHIFGHDNDFQWLPGGSTFRNGQGCEVAGCAAYPPSMGWLSCCQEDTTHRYGGAAWVLGSDGKRYMHLFVK